MLDLKRSKSFRLCDAGLVLPQPERLELKKPGCPYCINIQRQSTRKGLERERYPVCKVCVEAIAAAAAHSTSIGGRDDVDPVLFMKRNELLFNAG